QRSRNDTTDVRNGNGARSAGLAPFDRRRRKALPVAHRLHGEVHLVAVVEVAALVEAAPAQPDHHVLATEALRVEERIDVDGAAVAGGAVVDLSGLVAQEPEVAVGEAV